MEVSRLTFRKETKEAMNKGLNKMQKGRLRFNKLKELNESGELSMIKNRKELGYALGYTKEQLATSASPYICGLIKKGYINEILLNFDPITQKPQYEYHLTGKEPSAVIGRPKQNSSAKKKVEKELRRWQDKVEAGQIPEAPQPVLDTPTEPEVTVLASPIKLEFTKGDVCIKMELGNSKDASELIKTILNGA